MVRTQDLDLQKLHEIVACLVDIDTLEEEEEKVLKDLILEVTRKIIEKIYSEQ